MGNSQRIGKKNFMHLKKYPIRKKLFIQYGRGFQDEYELQKNILAHRLATSGHSIEKKNEQDDYEKQF